MSEEYVELSGVRIRVREGVYADDIVASLRSGEYEADERRVLPEMLWSGDRVIEIGSAVGCVSMTVARLVGADNILSFDANPHMVRDALANFVANGLAIPVQNAALKNRLDWSGMGETVAFHVNRHYWASSLVENQHTTETISVPVLCLEQQIEAFGANAIVCDIEGGESDLFQRADLSQIDKLMIEIHNWSGRGAVNSMIRKLIVDDGFTVNFDLSFGSIVSLHRGILPPARP